jgi:response regulator RpfG family c-di-GMP phosphodiesterase
MNSMEALEVMKRERGFMFNPELLDIFINHFEKFKDIKDRLG